MLNYSFDARGQGLFAIVLAVAATALYAGFQNADAVIYTLVVMTSVLWYAAAALIVVHATQTPDGFTDLEHCQIPSDEAYDYADHLERDDQTVVEDKRTGECYIANREADE